MYKIQMSKSKFTQKIEVDKHLFESLLAKFRLHFEYRYPKTPLPCLLTAHIHLDKIPQSIHLGWRLPKPLLTAS
jgi:hypothetical protein